MLSAITDRTSAAAQTGRPQHFDHPMPDLLELTAHEILARCRRTQQLELTGTLRQVRSADGDITAAIPVLHRYLAGFPSASLRRRLSVQSLEHLFLTMHEHVMAHPVWVHPFFVRITSGDITIEQLKRFSRHYFNQVKNTRQCVALALGRFHTLIDQPDAELNVVISELTQVVLAGLLADEYGFNGVHKADEPEPATSAAVDIAALFSPITHPELFRRFQRALGESVREYDTPMLHGVADNVLVQRILAGDPSYDALEALASVGLGMEWGVPAFFSMIMAGVLKAAARDGVTLDGPSMEIWSAHVRQDVGHAIAVMVATGFYVHDASDVRRIENATNTLMAFRYQMMSEIHEEVFGDECPGIAHIDLPSRYRMHDERISGLLVAARARNLRAEAVRDYSGYLRRHVEVPHG